MSLEDRKKKGGWRRRESSDLLSTPSIREQHELRYVVGFFLSSFLSSFFPFFLSFSFFILFAKSNVPRRNGFPGSPLILSLWFFCLLKPHPSLRRTRPKMLWIRRVWVGGWSGGREDGIHTELQETRRCWMAVLLGATRVERSLEARTGQTRSVCNMWFFFIQNVFIYNVYEHWESGVNHTFSFQVEMNRTFACRVQR